MHPEDTEHPGDEELDRLFQAAGDEEPPALDRIAFGFETRLLARLREERRSSWLVWAWRLCPVTAALALAAGIWSYARRDDSVERESLYAAVRLAGMPVIEYYLGRDE